MTNYWITLTKCCANDAENFFLTELDLCNISEMLVRIFGSTINNKKIHWHY
jgi:hypothetical protein